MSKKLLVLAKNVLFDEQQARLREAGFELLEKDPAVMPQDELIQIIADVDAALIGGWEQGTEAVFDAANKLKLIVFPGIGFQKAIPAWRYALDKGMHITNTPSAPTQSAAEWSIMAALVMSRGVFELGRTGSSNRVIVHGLEGREIGIFSLGRIGGRIGEMIQVFNPSIVRYYSTHKHPEDEQRLGVRYASEDELFENSDVLFIAAPDGIGEPYFTEDQLSKLKPGSLVVSISRIALFDFGAVSRAIDRGVIWAQDDPVAKMEEKYGPEKWFTNRGHFASHTHESLRAMGDTAVDTFISYFETGEVKNSIKK